MFFLTSLDLDSWTSSVLDNILNILTIVITFYNTELTSCQLAQNIYMRIIKIIILSQLLIWWPTLSLNPYLWAHPGKPRGKLDPPWVKPGLTELTGEEMCTEAFPRKTQPMLTIVHNVAAAGRPRAGKQVAEVGQRQTRRLSRSWAGTGSQFQRHEAVQEALSRVHRCQVAEIRGRRCRYRSWWWPRKEGRRY